MVGEMVAPDRAYWAAVAAFVTFTGASTTSETTRKAIDRIFGDAIEEERRRSERARTQ